MSFYFLNDIICSKTVKNDAHGQVSPKYYKNCRYLDLGALPTSELVSTLLTTYIRTTDLMNLLATSNASCLRLGTAMFCISRINVVSSVSNIYTVE